jgi:hypothetical protein
VIEKVRMVQQTSVALERKLRHGLLCDRRTAWPIIDEGPRVSAERRTTRSGFELPG